MGRWRPPAAGSTALITRHGHDRLKAELDDLWRVQRPEVVRALAAAAAEGDRSENAEYTYRKKQLGGIDRRVRYLSKRLEALRVVDARFVMLNAAPDAGRTAYAESHIPGAVYADLNRDLSDLSALFERLDRASLAAQRRLTVPFLRQVLDA